MNKLFELLKFKIKSTINIEKIKKMKKINLLFFGFIILYFGFSLTFSITMITDGAINTTKEYGLTFYSDRSEIGSGVNKINKRSKADLQLMGKIKF